jgi:hypothetical protein
MDRCDLFQSAEKWERAPFKHSFEYCLSDIVAVVGCEDCSVSESVAKFAEEFIALLTASLF